MSDRDTLARVVEEDGIATGDPELGVVRWLADAAETLLDRLLGPVGVALPEGERVLWIALAAAVLLLAGTGGLLLWQLRALRRGREGGPGEPLPTIPRSPADRRRLVEALLAAGRAREALAELWPLVAGGLAARGVGAWEPDLTVREFVATVPADWPGVPRLRLLGAAVERLAWAGDPPSVADVRGLLVEAETL
ncbi:MAG: hypothetical protein ACOZNI_07540 [Myxococcota bacterium]